MQKFSMHLATHDQKLKDFFYFLYGLPKTAANTNIWIISNTTKHLFINNKHPQKKNTIFVTLQHRIKCLYYNSKEMFKISSFVTNTIPFHTNIWLYGCIYATVLTTDLRSEIKDYMPGNI